MTVQVKFMQSGSFNSGEFKFLDLDKITRLQITRLRNTCELLATTPENPRPNTPYLLASREREYELQSIVDELQLLRKQKEDIVYEITADEAHRVK